MFGPEAVYCKTYFSFLLRVFVMFMQYVLSIFLFVLFLLAACQCNGHSQCVNESVCEKCEDLTTGGHCESCISGYYGDPTNGGSCQCEYLWVIQVHSKSTNTCMWCHSSRQHMTVVFFFFMSATFLIPGYFPKLPLEYIVPVTNIHPFGCFMLLLLS